MIDLHCHLLDETVCGPGTFQESLKLCRLAIADGVKTIVATPRWEAEADEPPLALDLCREKLERLRRETGDALALKSGFMMAFRADLSEVLEHYGKALTLGGGRYVLVQLPSLHVPSETEKVWEAIREKGYAVTVARPECNPALRHDPARLARWVASGIKLQLDAASINGAHGREIQTFSKHCAQKYQGSVVVASNSSKGRFHSLAAARAQFNKKNGRNFGGQFFNATPAAIIDTENELAIAINSAFAPPTRLSRLRSFNLQKVLSSES